MQVKQGEIVLISFPFSDKKRSKIRPGMIISNEKFNSYSRDCLIVPMTSVLKNTNYSFEIDNNNLDSGKLLKKSRIRINKITPIQKDLIKMKIGRVNPSILNKIKVEIKQMI